MMALTVNAMNAEMIGSEMTETAAETIGTAEIAIESESENENATENATAIAIETETENVIGDVCLTLFLIATLHYAHLW
jgi:hypothetical protein